MERSVLAKYLTRTFPSLVAIRDEASVSEARGAVRAIGQKEGFADDFVERMALVASELATNQLLHARLGTIGVRSLVRSGSRGLEIFAEDRGTGIRDIAAALRGKRQSENSGLGKGLSVVYDIVDELDLDVRAEEGTGILVRKFETSSEDLRCETAIVGRPIHYEKISGDNAIYLRNERGLCLAVVDGLGHGILAHDASALAMQSVLEKMDFDQSPDLVSGLQYVHERLKGTRGVVGGFANIDLKRRMLGFVGAGDVMAFMMDIRHHKRFSTRSLVLGNPSQKADKVILEELPITPGSCFVLCTDGIVSHFDIDPSPAFLHRPAAEIAEDILNNFSRPNDDALVAVVRFGNKVSVR